MRVLSKHLLLFTCIIAAFYSCTESPVEQQPLKPVTPSGITVVENSETVLSFTWNPIEGADRYAARLELGDGILKQQLNPVDASVTFSGLSKATEYVFKVRTVSGDLSSDYSEPMKVTTAGEEGGPDTPPDIPDDPQQPGEYYAEFKMPSHEDIHAKSLAFPGAEGGGMYVTGGRGGKVIRVTNLNDSGAGSLRDALNQSGPRIIVFDVAGVIQLKSTLKISKGDVTIAGQTAPGDGICIRDYSVQVSASNVIIRFMRFRMGDAAKQENDAIWGRYNDNIILDHCSMSWSTDECSSFYANENFTMQWCIITESLCNSVHGKGSHGYGGIWGGKNASFHHNLLANHKSRNPRFDHPEIYENKNNPQRRGHVDYRNNTVYNWGDNSTYGGEGAWFNMVGNYYKKGPASKDKSYFIDANGIYASSKTDYGYPYLYLSGNVYDGKDNLTNDNSVGVYWHDHKTNTPPDRSRLISSAHDLVHPSEGSIYTTTHDALSAFGRICECGGASLRRDSVDERACSDARSGKATYPSGGNGSKNGIIDTQDAVGGWPSYSATSEELASVKDSDLDGMPDWFEKKFGLNVNSPDDARSKDLDHLGRYDNLEMYLHFIVKDIVSGQSEGGTYQKLS